MILTCAFFSEIAGGLFHFKKDHAQYSLKPEDYANKPLFLASKENRFLSEFFLCILEDLHTCQSLPPRRKVGITPPPPHGSRRQLRACACAPACSTVYYTLNYYTLNLPSGKSCCGSFGWEPADLRTCTPI